MDLLAELALTPGGVISWILVGLLSGWLAGVAMQGSGFGMVGDILLGLVGAFVGGLIASFFIVGEAGFWGSIVLAFVGACVVLAIAGMFSPGRAPRM